MSSHAHPVLGAPAAIGRESGARLRLLLLVVSDATDCRLLGARVRVGHRPCRLLSASTEFSARTEFREGEETAEKHDAADNHQRLTGPGIRLIKAEMEPDALQAFLLIHRGEKSNRQARFNVSKL